MTTQHHDTPDVIVVGGGIGGLSRRRRADPQGSHACASTRRSAEFGEVGAGLQIAPNCTRILDDYGLLDEVKSLGVLPDVHGDEGRDRRLRADPARPGSTSSGATASPTW